MAAPPSAPVRALREEVARLLAQGSAGPSLARHMSDGIDVIVREAFARTFDGTSGAALLALGGYGRRELAPYSDVDLLLVLADDRLPEAESLASRLFTPLWDAGLELGTAVRTRAQALEAVAAEQTIATALLDGRFLAGDGELAGALQGGFAAWLESDGRAALVRAKVDEVRQRRERFGGSVYLLEPNVKMGVGGVRDLAALGWLSRLGDVGVDSAHALEGARDRLWRVRCALHLQARRRDDRLTFAAQEALAERLGSVDGEYGTAVESFMRDWYLAAREVERALEAVVERWALLPGGAATSLMDPRFERCDGRVEVSVPTLEADPAACVALFVAAERAGLPVGPLARQRVSEVAERLVVDEDVRKECLSALLSYWEMPGATGEAMRGLYDAGLLGAMFPEFARLKARVQHDAYHVFTVDTHTLLAVQQLLRLRAGLMAVDQPQFTRLVQALPRPLPLVIGMFFHDLGKGLGGEHSVKGEALVRAFGERCGLLARDVIEDAAFLVREHLKLSQVAFRRDLSDEALLADVARLVGTRERLDMLYLLTYVDIASVGPETWNDWRARLLGELHAKVRERLEAGRASQPDRSAASLAGARALAEAVDDPMLEGFVALLPERYLATVPTREAVHHFELWRQAPEALTLELHPAPGHDDAGRLTLLADDRPGLLAAVAGTLAAHGIDILAAELFPLGPDRVLDTFLVREPGQRAPTPERVARARADLVRVLAGDESAPDLIARRRGGASTIPTVPVAPPRVRFDLEAAADATVVDVWARDRPGLLHDIADALHRAGATIVLARIATEGHRATDGFYVKDFEGRKIIAPEKLARLEAALAEAIRER
jgi:[protein-PII] uridylyltransferase